AAACDACTSRPMMLWKSFSSDMGGPPPHETGALLDVPDRNDCRGLRQLFARVLRPDAVDVMLAGLGKTVGGLHPALGDEDAEIGSLEAVVARSVDAQEEALVLVRDVV